MEKSCFAEFSLNDGNIPTFPEGTVVESQCLKKSLYNMDKTASLGQVLISRTKLASREDILNFVFQFPRSTSVKGRIFTYLKNQRSVIHKPTDFTHTNTHGFTHVANLYSLSEIPIDSSTKVRIELTFSNALLRQFPCSIESLSSDFTSLLISEKDSDVVIIVEGKEFKAHRTVLKTRSAYFAKMFASRMSEDTTGQVEMTGVSEEAFAIILKFIYSGIVDEAIETHAPEVLGKADEMRLMELRGVCVDTMTRKISTSNICDFFRAAHLFECEELKEKCLDFFVENAKAVMKTKGWAEVANVPELVSEVVARFAEDDT